MHNKVNNAQATAYSERSPTHHELLKGIPKYVRYTIYNEYTCHLRANNISARNC